MNQKLIYSYSTAFKRQVIEDLESGRFCSIHQFGQESITELGAWRRYPIG